MKRFFFIALFLMFFVVWPNVVLAQEATTSATPTVTPSVNYDLAYPGLMPDHPLYFFKVIRDKVVSYLINDPVKRAEFNLLTSDKRFNAAVYLADKNNDEKAVDTFSKSNNYFHDSIVALEKAKKLDRDVSSLKDQEHVAIAKREQIAKGLKSEISPSYQAAFKLEVNRLKKLDDRLNGL